MALVPDSSVIVSQALDDEDATYAEAVIEAIASDEAIVPTLFWFELRNALLMGERRQRSTTERTSSFLADIALLPFAVDESPREAVVLDLARSHTLTVYDAAYIELALRKGVALATLDKALIKAAKAVGVTIFKEVSQ
jgi:predicted nucleic acid-binding protein